MSNFEELPQYIDREYLLHPLLRSWLNLSATEPIWQWHMGSIWMWTTKNQQLKWDKKKLPGNLLLQCHQWQRKCSELWEVMPLFQHTTYVCALWWPLEVVVLLRIPGSIYLRATSGMFGKGKALSQPTGECPQRSAGRWMGCGCPFKAAKGSPTKPRFGLGDIWQDVLALGDRFGVEIMHWWQWLRR